MNKKLLAREVIVFFSSVFLFSLVAGVIELKNYSLSREVKQRAEAVRQLDKELKEIRSRIDKIPIRDIETLDRILYPEKADYGPDYDKLKKKRDEREVLRRKASVRRTLEGLRSAQYLKLAAIIIFAVFYGLRPCIILLRWAFKTLKE